MGKMREDLEISGPYCHWWILSKAYSNIFQGLVAGEKFKSHVKDAWNTSQVLSSCARPGESPNCLHACIHMPAYKSDCLNFLNQRFMRYFNFLACVFSTTRWLKDDRVKRFRGTPSHAIVIAQHAGYFVLTRLLWNDRKPSLEKGNGELPW